MCAPLAIAIPLVSLAVKGVSSIAATKSARSQADRDQAANTKLVNDTRAEAVDSTQRALQDLDSRELEDMLAASQQKDQITRVSNSDVSTATVAAGESGVTGQSIDELLMDVKSQASRNRQTVNTNTSISQAQLDRDRAQVLATGKSQYNSVQPVKINKPSYLGAALGIASDALGVVDYAQSRSHALKIPTSGT